MAHQRPIDKEFEDADDTGVLVLSSRNLRTFPIVPGELCDFNDVLEADFSNNRFDHIPAEVCVFSALVKLNFYCNSLRTVPDDLRHLENLRDLNLSRNFLAKVPLGLCHMGLHSLDISNNRLVSLPLELGSLKQLRYLNLSCNQLPDLPPSIIEMNSLQHLDLHRNQLKEVPGDIHLLPLRYLDISCNQIQALPSTLRHLEDSLSIFKMADNPIESPPTHVCVRGLRHIVKWMEALEKHGSDPHLLSSASREASLARRSKNKRLSTSRGYMEHQPVENGSLNLVDEMTHLVNTTLGDKTYQKNDGEVTPTFSTPLHWSVAQFVPDKNQASSPMSDQSKEEYREAAHKLYMQQERQKQRDNRRKRASSPNLPTAKAAVALARQQSGSVEFNSLPRRSSKEELLGGATGGTRSVGGSPRVTGPSRSLPGERYPRPGSWNSHVKVTSSPILPSKYSLPANEKPASEEEGASARVDSDEERGRQKQTQGSRDFVIRRNAQSTGEARRPAEDQHKKPPPMETSGTSPQAHLPHPDEVIKASPASHSGSVTPTNEDGSVTPQLVGEVKVEGQPDTESTLVAANIKLQKEASERVGRGKEKEAEEKAKWRQSLPEGPMVIENLETSPKASRRHPSAGDAEDIAKKDATWPRSIPPRKKKEKDVFRFLKEHDSNYTVRRQEFQMNMIIEKSRRVKEQIESLLGLELSDDIGEWVSDGVVPCQVVKKLHPHLLATVHTPPEGQVLPRARKTVNIANFIAACRQLNVSEEELCSAGDLIELKDPVRVVTCLQRVLELASPVTSPH